ncbi:MAG: flagellar FliJ family protein [Firmicutes bacterium]|nr:flagellar FliJ family protein [Bacillota bacterium]
MRRFKFRLETNLKVVQIREDLQRQELQQIQTRLTEARDTLLRLELQYRGLEQEIRDISAKRLDLDLLRLFRDYLGVVNRLIKQQHLVIRGLEAELAECREKLKKLLMERKLLERLKSRRWEQYQYETLVEEQKLVDEMGINQYLSLRSN